MPNVLLLPGVLGSSLGFAPPGAAAPHAYYNLQNVIWLNPLYLVTNAVINLQLASDGVSPGPLTWGYPVESLGVLASGYQPLIDWMVAQGWNVYPLGYDWRKSIQISAAAVWAAAQEYFQGSPFVIVAHSMGGLVARWVWKLALAAGQPSQIARIITLGTPHFGSLTALMAFFALNEYYDKLAAAIGWRVFPDDGAHSAVLDTMLASWPGWYELLPWRDSGPFFQNNQAAAAAIYQTAFYTGLPLISQGWLNAAAATQDALANVFPPAPNLVCFAGTKYITPVDLSDLASGVSADSYVPGTGDGVVPVDWASPTGVIAIQVPYMQHGLFPLTPNFFPMLAPFVWGAPGQ